MFKKILFIIFALSSQAYGFLENQEHQSSRNTFNKYVKSHNYSGCYLIPTSIAEYTDCMAIKAWRGAYADTDLKEMCKILSPNDQERQICFSVAALASKKSTEAETEKAIITFTSIHDQLSAGRKTCFEIGVVRTSYEVCLSQLPAINLIRDEITYLDTLRSQMLTLGNGRPGSDAWQEKLDYTALSEIATQVLEDKKKQIRAELDRTQSIENAAIQVAAAEAQFEEIAKEETLQKECGVNYQTVKVGMSETTLIKCSSASLVGAKGKTIKIYQTPGGLTVRVVNGKVTMWLQ